VEIRTLTLYLFRPTSLLETELLLEISKMCAYHDWANHQVLDAASMLNVSEQDRIFAVSFFNRVEVVIPWSE
jgi:hypothetical protein